MWAVTSVSEEQNRVCPEDGGSVFFSLETLASQVRDHILNSGPHDSLVKVSDTLYVND
jgi:hypothetical protein